MSKYSAPCANYYRCRGTDCTGVIFYGEEEQKGKTADVDGSYTGVPRETYYEDIPAEPVQDADDL